MSAQKAVFSLCIILYLTNEASSLKCYKCDSTSSGDCYKRPTSAEVQICPGSINLDSSHPDLKDYSSPSALTNIRTQLANVVPRAASDPQCLTLIGSVGDTKGVIRQCTVKELTDEYMKAIAEGLGMTSITISRCETDLCNSSSALSIGFLTLASSLLLVFSMKF